jgi:hypothetical protein
MSDEEEVLATDPHLPAELPPPKQIKGRKGSKNKITTLKLMAEEAARDRNQQRINYVLDLIISQAGRGDKASQRLVWQAVMTQGLANDQKASEKVQINIGTYHDEPVKVKNVEPVIKPAEIIDGEIITKDVKHEKQSSK